MDSCATNVPYIPNKILDGLRKQEMEKIKERKRLIYKNEMFWYATYEAVKKSGRWIFRSWFWKQNFGMCLFLIAWGRLENLAGFKQNPANYQTPEVLDIWEHKFMILMENHLHF